MTRLGTAPRPDSATGCSRYPTPGWRGRPRALVASVGDRQSTGSGSHRLGVSVVGGENVLEFDDSGEVGDILVSHEEGDGSADQPFLVLVCRAQSVENLRGEAEP